MTTGTQFSDWQQAGGGGLITSISPPLSAPGGDLTLPQANTTTDGYLSAFDWNRFNTAAGGGVTGIGTYNSQAPVADGLFINDGILYAQDASATDPGMVGLGSQTWLGEKTFQTGIFTAALNLSAIAPNFALETDGSSNVIASTTTATELGYVHGVTSSIQTQINALVPVVENANTVYSGPTTGVPALPTFRAMVTADIPNNIVTNAQLAQMPSLTIKGNNTAGLANAADLTTTQVTAMLNTFVGDTGAGGTQGLVPAPAAGTTLQGDFLSANGTFKYVDQSKPDSPSFSLVTQVSNPFALAKLNNVLTYTGVNGKSYAVTIGAVASTLAFYDITNQSAPTYLSNMTTLQGSYNAVHALIGGIDYIIVASSGGFNLYIINASNPSLPTITTTFALGNPTGATYNLAYQNGYVYLACQSVGLKVVDIGGGLGGGTLLAPVVTYTQGAAKSFGVAISGNVLYTTQYSTSPYATRLLNSWTLTGLGTPIVPSLTQSLVLPGLGETLAVSINATTAFISNTTGVQQIDIVDITTPTAMTNITSISMPGGYALAAGMVAVPYGNYLFMPVGSHATFGGSILMYDITNRASPILVSTVSNNVATSPFGGISILGQYIFAGDYGPAPGSLGNLDVFTLPLMAPVMGSSITSNLQIQNSFQIGNSTTTGYVWTAINNQGLGAWQASSGGSGSYAFQEFTLSSTDITNKFVTLATTPTAPTKAILTMIDGFQQRYTVDFTITGNQLNWSGLGLDGFLISGNQFTVQYY